MERKKYISRDLNFQSLVPDPEKLRERLRRHTVEGGVLEREGGWKTRRREKIASQRAAHGRIGAISSEPREYSFRSTYSGPKMGGFRKVTGSDSHRQISFSATKLLRYLHNAYCTKVICKYLKH
eukprot:491600-Amorphochlora_amoeboformis.AAC.1